MNNEEEAVDKVISEDEPDAPTDDTSRSVAQRMVDDVISARNKDPRAEKRAKKEFKDAVKKATVEVNDAVKEAKRRLAAEKKEKTREAIQMALFIISLVFVILAVGCAYFSFIFPINNVLMTEYNREIWIAFTVAAAALAVVSLVISIINAVKKSDSASDFVGLFVCGGVMFGWALIALLVGGLKQQMFGWGISVLCVGGVCGVASAFFEIDASSSHSSVIITLVAYVVTIALCGVTYTVTEQPVNYVKTDDGLYYIVREDNTLTVFADSYGIEELVIPSEIDGYRVTAVAKPKVTSKSGALKSIVLPESVWAIENDAFSGCTGLESVKLPGGLRSLGERAFYGCRSLKTVEFNDKLITVGDGAFENCISLKTVDIPDSVTALGKRAFKGCAKLETADVGSKYIYEEAFANCSALETVTLTDHVQSIGVRAFAGDILLSSIYIPTSVDVIGAGAFDRCISLTAYLGHGPNLFTDLPVETVHGVTRDEYGEIVAAKKEE